MLVLSRKSGESVRIGSDIHVTVIAVGRGRVRLGFEAPARVAIVRSELDRKARGNSTIAAPQRSDVEICPIGSPDVTTQPPAEKTDV